MKCSVLGVLVLCSACAASPVPYPSPVSALVPTTITLLPVAYDSITLIATVLDQNGRGVPGAEVWFSVDTVKHITDSYGAASYTMPSPRRAMTVRATSGDLVVDAYVTPIITPPAPIDAGYEPPPPVPPLPSGPSKCECYPLPECCHACNRYTNPLMGAEKEGVPT